MAPGVVCGYVAVFNRVGLGSIEFPALIDTGAFAECLGQKIPALVEHDPDVFLGDTRSGSLRLHQDDAGLFAELELPDNDFGRWVKRKTFSCWLTGWSFKWRCDPGDQRRYDLPGRQSVVVIRRFSRLSEISLAHNPAFRCTTLKWRPDR